MLTPRADDPPVPRALTILAWAAAGAALVHALVILFGWLNDPLLDQHAFRQLQTALSAYWITQGGPWLAYETPVLGSPWSIPFEAPVYHLPVALLAWLGLPLEAAGRLVSFSCLIAAAWPLRMLWRDLALPPLGYPILCALLLASPLYLFWGRSFLIESCAWFLALLALAFFVRFLRSERAVHALAALLAGSLAVLAKATTFPAFALAGGLVALALARPLLRGAGPARALRLALWGGAALLLPFAVGFAWVAFSDGAKAQNPLGAQLTSAALAGWNYGNLEQRLSGRLWGRVGDRMLSDVFGLLGAGTLLMLAAAWPSRRSRAVVAACVLLFLTPILLFTNLHLVHNYYQYANGAFLLAALAVALGTLPRWRRGVGLTAALLLVVLASQMARFHHRNMAAMARGAAGTPTQRIGLLARELVPPGGSLLVLGDDWSSAVPYFAQRRSLALPNFAAGPIAEAVLRDPQAHLAGTRLGGVVDCLRPGQGYGAALQPRLEAFLAGRQVLAQAGHCRLLSAERPTP